MRKRKAPPERRGDLLHLKPAVNKETGLVFLTGCSVGNTGRWIYELYQYAGDERIWWVPTPKATVAVNVAQGQIVTITVLSTTDEAAVATYLDMLQDFVEAVLEEHRERMRRKTPPPVAVAA